MCGMQRIVVIWGIVGMIACTAAWESWAQESQLPASQTSWQIVAQESDEPARGEMPPMARIQGIDVENVQINWGKLGLSEAQKKQFVAKRREFQIETAGIRQELNFLQQDLRAEMTKNSADRAAIDSLLEKMTSTKQHLSELAVQNLLDIKGLLTPEQIEKLEGFQAQLPPDLQGLKLTAEQRKTMAKMMSSALQKDRQATGQLQMLRTELQELLFSADEPDQARLVEVQEAIVEQEMVLERARIDLFLQMREVLTSEQLDRYQTFRERRTHESDHRPQPDQQKQH